MEHNQKSTAKPPETLASTSLESESFDSWTLVADDAAIKPINSSTDVDIIKSNENEPSGIEYVGNEEEPKTPDDDLSDEVSIISECESTGRITPLSAPQNNENFEPLTPPNTPSSSSKDKSSQTSTSAADRISRFFDLVSSATSSSSRIEFDNGAMDRAASSAPIIPVANDQSTTETILSCFCRLPTSKIFFVSVLIALFAFFGNNLKYSGWHEWNLSTQMPQLFQRVEDLELQNNLLRAEIDILSKGLNSLNQKSGAIGGSREKFMNKKDEKFSNNEENKQKKWKQQQRNNDERHNENNNKEQIKSQIDGDDKFIKAKNYPSFNEKLESFGSNINNKFKEKIDEMQFESKEKIAQPKNADEGSISGDNGALPTYCKDGENLWCSTEEKQQDDTQKQENVVQNDHKKPYPQGFTDDDGSDKSGNNYHQSQTQPSKFDERKTEKFMKDSVSAQKDQKYKQKIYKMSKEQYHVDSEQKNNYERKFNDEDDNRRHEEFRKKSHDSKDGREEEVDDDKEKYKTHREKKFEEKRVSESANHQHHSNNNKERLDTKPRYGNDGRKNKFGKKHYKDDYDDDDDDDSKERHHEAKKATKRRDSRDKNKEFNDSRESYEKKRDYETKNGKEKHYDGKNGKPNDFHHYDYKGDDDWYDKLMHNPENIRHKKNNGGDNNWYLERRRGREEARFFKNPHDED